MTEIYIPKNLEECFAELDHFLIYEDRKALKANTGGFHDGFHFSLGMWIRNHWGLWERGPLWDYFNKMGLEHPDDMSSIILSAYRCHLNHMKYDILGAIEYYKNYWIEYGVEHPFKGK